MTVESLMTQTVTVFTPASESQNAIGEVTVTYSSTSTMMAIQPRNGREAQPDGNVPIGDWYGFGAADFPWDAAQRITWDGHTFDIVAPPRPEPNQRLGTISHYELDLQEIDAVESP